MFPPRSGLTNLVATATKPFEDPWRQLGKSKSETASTQVPAVVRLSQEGSQLTLTSKLLGFVSVVLVNVMVNRPSLESAWMLSWATFSGSAKERMKLP